MLLKENAERQWQSGFTNVRFRMLADLRIGTEEVVRSDLVGVAAEAARGKILPRTRTGTCPASSLGAQWGDGVRTYFGRCGGSRSDILHICDLACCVSTTYQIYVRHVSAIRHSLSRAWGMIRYIGTSPFNTNTLYSKCLRKRLNYRLQMLSFISHC